MQLQALTQSLALNTLLYLLIHFHIYNYTLLYLLIHSHIYNYTLPTLHCSPNWPPIIALRGLYCNLIMPNVPIVSLLCRIFLLWAYYAKYSYCLNIIMSNILIAILLCLKLLRLNVQTKNFFAAFPVASNMLFLGKHKTQPLELGAPKSGSNSIEF